MTTQQPANALDALTDAAARIAAEWVAQGRYTIEQIDQAIDAAILELTHGLAGSEQGRSILDRARRTHDIRTVTTEARAMTATRKCDRDERIAARAKA